MKRLVGALVGVAVLIVGLQDAAAKKAVVNLTSEELTTRTEASEEMGNYYLLAVPVPQEVEGRRVIGAYLEMSLDASVSGPASDMDPAPRLQVFALTEAMGETFDAGKLHKGAGVVPVPVGSSKLARVDVTDVIRGWLKAPATNHGLAIGALTGTHGGRFVLNSGVLGTGVVARLVVVYESD